MQKPTQETLFAMQLFQICQFAMCDMRYMKRWLKHITFPLYSERQPVWYGGRGRFPPPGWSVLAL